MLSGALLSQLTFDPSLMGLLEIRWALNEIAVNESSFIDWGNFSANLCLEIIDDDNISLRAAEAPLKRGRPFAVTEQIPNNDARRRRERIDPIL